jgi:succinate dehydrogenase/fumarate reductase flavoprotein subunit
LPRASRCAAAPCRHSPPQDSPQAFYEDTARSARDLLNKDLVKVLTFNSASAVEWLQDKFRLDLSLVSRLGGHSFPRTHRGKERFPGMTITYALMERLEDTARERPDLVQILIKSRVTRLLKDGDRVIGVEYEANGAKATAYGPVVLATGGYAADFTEDSLLKKVRCVHPADPPLFTRPPPPHRPRGPSIRAQN